MRLVSCLLLAFFALTQAPVASSQGISGGHIWIVDPAGGPDADATSIQAAINLAANGDRILVRDGRYGPFVVKAKSLSIEAAQGARVVVLGPIEVRDLAASQWSFLRGFHTESGVVAEKATTLHANSGVGQIWVEDCTFGVPADSFSWFQGSAVTTSGARLILVRVTLRGGSSHDEHHDGSAALHIQSSNVWAHASTFVGGHGFSPSILFPLETTDGGPGIRVDTGFLSIAGSTAIGGDGGQQEGGFLCFDGGDGAPAIELGGLFPVYESHDLRLLAGIGGAGFLPLCAPGITPPALTDLGGASITEHAGASVFLAAPSPVAQGDVQSLTLTGTPGDVVLLRYAFFHDLTEIPGMIGWDMLLEPAYFLGGVIVPPSGTATVERQVPLIALPYESFTFHMQPIALQANGQLVFGSPTAFGILPPSF